MFGARFVRWSAVRTKLVGLTSQVCGVSARGECRRHTVRHFWFLSLHIDGDQCKFLRVLLMSGSVSCTGNCARTSWTCKCGSHGVFSDTNTNFVPHDLYFTFVRTHMHALAAQIYLTAIICLSGVIFTGITSTCISGSCASAGTR